MDRRSFLKGSVAGALSTVALVVAREQAIADPVSGAEFLLIEKRGHEDCGGPVERWLLQVGSGPKLGFRRCQKCNFTGTTHEYGSVPLEMALPKAVEI